MNFKIVVAIARHTKEIKHLTTYERKRYHIVALCQGSKDVYESPHLVRYSKGLSAKSPFARWPYFTSYSPLIHNIPVQISTITQIEYLGCRFYQIGVSKGLFVAQSLCQSVRGEVGRGKVNRFLLERYGS